MDYEDKDTYTVTVTATDPRANEEATITVTITVTDVNETPTVTGLTDSISYPENSASPIATYTVSDPENDDITLEA